MKKSVKIILAAVALVIVIVGVLFLVVLPSILNNAAKLQAYEFGDRDRIPSFTSVVGDRKVTGVSTAANSGGSQVKKYTYQTDTRDTDRDAYMVALLDAGFLVVKSLEGNELKGATRLGIASADDGKIILIDFSWDSTTVAVELTKGEGTVTPN